MKSMSRVQIKDKQCITVCSGTNQENKEAKITVTREAENFFPVILFFLSSELPHKQL